MTEERPPIIVIERNPELDNEESINIAIGIDRDASEQEMMAGFVALFGEMMKDEDLLHAFMGGFEIYTMILRDKYKTHTKDGVKYVRPKIKTEDMS